MNIRMETKVSDSALLLNEGLVIQEEPVEQDGEFDLELDDQLRNRSESVDSDWETDLEIEEPRKSFDASGRRLYLGACARIGVTPVSYFLMHIQKKEIVLRHHGLGASGAKAIAIALLNNATASTLDLHDNDICDDGARYIADMVKENCYITSINLSSNKIGHVGCAAICDMLNNSGIIHDLNIADNLFTDKDAAGLAHCIMTNEQLVNLNLSGNQFCEEGGVVLGPSIAANDSIEFLDLSKNHIRRKGATGIAAGLKSNFTLKVLDLSWNGFDDDSARALCDALKVNNTLMELNLRCNRISSAGAAHIAKGLESNDTLEVLNISQNPIQTPGAHLLLNAIRNKVDSGIHTLYLEDIYLDDEFFVLLKKLNEQRTVKVVGRSRPSEKSPLEQIKDFIRNNYDRWMEVFGVYDPDGCGLISWTQFVEGLKEVKLSFDGGQMTWLCISLRENYGSQVNYKKPAEGIKRNIISVKKTPTPTNTAPGKKKNKK